MKVISNTKDKITDAAIDLFAEKGYTETSVKEIASRAGIRAASIYFHFSSKMELLAYILELYAHHALINSPGDKELEEIISSGGNGKEVLKKFFYEFSSMDQERYSKILKIILQEQYRDEQVHDFVKTYFIKQNEAFFKNVLERLVQMDKLPSGLDCRVTARLINSLNIASCVEYAHYTPEEYATMDRVKRWDVVEFLIDCSANSPQPD